ncbi:MAG: FG-GAP repeat domain-containing protein [Planctomycetota bacterium]|jgi:hypothetical protein
MLRAALVHKVLFIILSSFFLLTATAKSQELLAEMKLEGLFGPISDEVGVLGDLDGDPFMDLIVAGAEGVFVISGVDGTKVKHIPTGPETIIKMTGIGDVDNDDVPDFAISDWNTVRAYSTETGELLWTVTGSIGGAMGDRPRASRTPIRRASTPPARCTSCPAKTDRTSIRSKEPTGMNGWATTWIQLRI